MSHPLQMQQCVDKEEEEMVVLRVPVVVCLFARDLFANEDFAAFGPHLVGEDVRRVGFTAQLFI